MREMHIHLEHYLKALKYIVLKKYQVKVPIMYLQPGQQLQYFGKWIIELLFNYHQNYKYHFLNDAWQQLASSLFYYIFKLYKLTSVKLLIIAHILHKSFQSRKQTNYYIYIM